LARARTSSTTANCGSQSGRRRPSTISAETMASVSGILMERWCPRQPPTDVDGAADLVDIGAPTSMPTPRPETEVTAAAVRSPAQRRTVDWAPSSLKVSLGDETVATALALIRSVLRPLPLSAMQMMMWPPS